MSDDLHRYLPEGFIGISVAKLAEWEATVGLLQDENARLQSEAGADYKLRRIEFLRAWIREHEGREAFIQQEQEWARSADLKRAATEAGK